MKIMSFHYHMGIDFDSPVNDHSFLLRCFPCTDGRQQVVDLDYDISPSDSLSESFDNFGNRCIAGCTRAPHLRLGIDVHGVVKTGISGKVPVMDDYREHIFRYATELTKADEDIAEAAGTLQEEDVLSMSDKIMSFLGDRITYTANVTGINTTAAESFALGMGVCQDYSHIMLAMLRSCGISCRYVVGMIPGEGLSHAWVEVRSGDSWYGFDPTNIQRVGDGYIKMSHGRDYNDCVINKGFFYGDARQKQVISVRVTEMEQ